MTAAGGPPRRTPYPNYEGKRGMQSGPLRALTASMRKQSREVEAHGMPMKSRREYAR
jgi:hypothetical protein